MNWKLLAGRLRDAWLGYPSARKRIASVPHGRPIFLTGTHRSGTTWLAGMLAASGIWYVHVYQDDRDWIGDVMSQQG